MTESSENKNNKPALTVVPQIAPPDGPEMTPEGGWVVHMDQSVEAQTRRAHLNTLAPKDRAAYIMTHRKALLSTAVDKALLRPHAANALAKAISLGGNLQNELQQLEADCSYENVSYNLPASVAKANPDARLYANLSPDMQARYDFVVLIHSLCDPVRARGMAMQGKTAEPAIDKFEQALLWERIGKEFPAYATQFSTHYPGLVTAVRETITKMAKGSFISPV